MKRLATGLALTAALLLSVTAEAAFVNLASANFMTLLPDLVINSDGTVSPETEFIKQTGNVYTLAEDISQEYAIVINCSNIIFDGAGNVINGTLPSAVYGYANNGLSLEDVTNVTVKDLEVGGFIANDISIVNCSGCSIHGIKASKAYLEDSNFNTIVENSIGGNAYYFIMYSSNNNIIFRNNISAMQMFTCYSNTFFENNFGSNDKVVNEANSWDNGSVGNYWSDYLTKYPNAKEIGSSGIGDTPYVIDAGNVDHYPLMAPVDNVSPSIEVLSLGNRTYDASSVPLNFMVNEVVTQITYSLDGEENVTITGNTTLAGLANGDHTLTIYAKDEAGNVGTSETTRFTVDVPPVDVPFPTALVITASGASAAIIGVSLLVYFKKRRH